MSEGQGVKRFDVMYNDFVIVGPKTDPAHIVGGKDVVDALNKIAAAKATFISRGDHSGTHEAELRLWKEAGIDVGAANGSWYREIGGQASECEGAGRTGVHRLAGLTEGAGDDRRVQSRWQAAIFPQCVPLASISTEGESPNGWFAYLILVTQEFSSACYAKQ
jgi:hypothetical protein